MRGSSAKLWAFAIAATLLLAACGHSSARENAASMRPAKPAQPASFHLNNALAEIDAMAKPDGVDPNVFSQLKDALRVALEARSKGKLASAPPAGTANAVPDLQIADAGGGTVNLAWHYYNLGDYNQDGIVNVSDITPIAVHFGENVPSNPGDENLLISVINGAGGPKIGVDDITPIAMYYGAKVANYNIETSPTQGGIYTPVQQIALSTALDVDTQRAHFLVNFAPVYTNWYRVVPADSLDVTGVCSNEVLAIASAWVHTWGLSGSDDTNGVAFDESGNVYMVGSTDGSGAGNFDVLLLKYSRYGDFIWARTWGSVNKDEGCAICYDSTTQSLIVLGNTQSFGAGQSDLLLLRFSTDGDLQMQRAWGGPSNEWASRVVTGGGDIYLCAATNSYGAGDFDALVMKVSPFGAVVWAKTWGGATYDTAGGLALDSSGNLCVVGYTTSYGVGSGDVMMLKYDTAGNLLSQSVWGTAGIEAGLDVAFDGSDNILIGGTRLGPGQDALVMKLNAAGDLAWAKALIGANVDAFMGIAVDAYGNSLAYGTTNSTSLGGLDLLFAAYDSSGSLITKNAWGTPLDDRSSAVSLGSDGYLYCAGQAPNALGSWVTPSFTEEEITTGTLSDAAGTETAPATQMIDVTGIVQAPVGEVQDTGAGGTDALIMKMLLLS